MRAMRRCAWPPKTLRPPRGRATLARLGRCGRDAGGLSVASKVITGNPSGEQITRPTAVMGSPLYMAPETFRGVGAAAMHDAHIAPTQVRPQLPRSVDVVVARALKKAADERYQTMSELLAAVEVYLPKDRHDT